MELVKWQTQLRKGLLELCVLNLLAGGESHGYEMVRRLKEADGMAIREGNIYPVLARLQEDGMVLSRTERSSQGPPRRYFRLTAAGRSRLAEMNGQWLRVVESIGRLQDGGKVGLQGGRGRREEKER